MLDLLWIRQPMPLRFFSMLVATLVAAVAAEPAAAVTQNAAVSASVAKPLEIKALQALDLGSVLLGPGVWSGATVSISQTGVFSCTNPNLTCSGATMTARFNVRGSNKMVVLISAPDVTLVNALDSSQTLLLTLSAPSQVVLTSSGAPGNDFDIGGSISLDSAVAAGDYTGTLNVTAEYQ